MRYDEENAATPPVNNAGRSSAYLPDVIRIIVINSGLIFLLLVVCATAGYGESFHNALSLQGYTGLLNTPNAEVTDEGKFYALFTNQKEDKWRARTPREESYLFSVGFFSFAELGGRLTDAPGVTRDLSGNLKFKVPFIPKGYYLPDVAFGIQDVGGGAKFMQTKYLVATEELWRFRLSLGYGSGPNRMKGVFGGAEFKACDWLYLIGENDTKETNIGARLVTPSIFSYPLNLQVTAKSSLDHQPGNFEFGVGLQFPLGFNHNNRTPLPEETGVVTPQAITTDAASGTTREEKALGAASGSTSAPAGIIEKSDIRGEGNSRLQQLQVKLTAGGFQNVQVGTGGEALLVVAYENSRYNHNELDGLGVVIGTVVDSMPSGYGTLRLVIKKKGIRVLQLSAPLELFRAFLHDPGRYGEFNEMLRITPKIADDGGVSYVAGSANPSWLKSELVVYPGLKTFVGTEVGTFDYLLSAKLDFYLNTWKGSVLNARWDIPVNWSENFNDGKAFRGARNDSQLERLMMFQTLKVAPEVMVNLGGGMVLHDAYGTLNELMWTPGDGTHRIMVKQAYVAGTGNHVPHKKNEVYLASYRYFASPLDLYFTGTGGKFFDNDKGFSIEMKRFFGDTAFSAFYKNSWTAEREHVQVGGVQVAFPLTLRRDMKPYPVQLKGSDEWSYAQETKIVTSGNANSVSTSIGVNPQPPYNLERVFFNRDRLSETYIRNHLLRLRDAYLTYR